MSEPAPRFDHLAALTDERALFEHARYASPRREHGYCVDDAARALVVVCREPSPSPMVVQLANRYLGFVLSALDVQGRCRNRMAVGGEWRDGAALGDWWGRAVWGLGAAAVHGDDEPMRARALDGFRVALRARSPHRRSMAFAALGAGEVLARWPAETAAHALLEDAVRVIGAPGSGIWPWPEPRLTYGNAVLAEALIVAGDALNDATTTANGLRMLAFLVQLETRDGHLSVTPVGGRGREDTGPRFDQQPIEVAALADACAAAYRVTRDPQWPGTVRLAWRWFAGDNDSGAVMVDSMSGGGYDGLEAHGRNENQGAESTLAALSTAQHARRLDCVPCR